MTQLTECLNSRYDFQETFWPKLSTLCSFIPTQ